MQKSDGASDCQVVVSAVGAAIGASGAGTKVVGKPVDTMGFGTATCVVATDTLADTDVVLTPEIEESDDLVDGNFSAVSDDDLAGLEGSLEAVDDLTTRKIGYTGTKRYIRVNVTPDNTDDSNKSTFMSSVILGTPRKAPLSQEFKNELTVS